jgi:hypothetical protein
MSGCALHGQEQCPLCDPLPKIPFRPEPPASQFNMAIGTDGNPLPYSPEEVKQVALKAVDGGELLAAVFRLSSGDLSVQVFGPPSHELVDALEQAVSQYKRVLRLQVAPPAGRA